ncbi:XdhC family protein [uncultured Kiloniella sp.]|uniref:XdhC family protein n=1 Tax=uncultured Kiloniella sp. TaxID=1133091 RepID=UPI0026397D3A|nr:XdhC family protein [uncultured Kiloniella sp.]
MKRITLDQLNRAKSAKETTVLLTDLKSGEQELVYPQRPDADHPLLDILKSAVRDDKSYVHATENSETFIQVFNPPLRLIIVGAVHISQFLVPMAQSAGYEVILIDPRSAFGNKTRFPNCNITNEWPDEAMEVLKPDHRTAVVLLTHDPKLDDPALVASLQSDAFYIGALGSKRTHAKRLDRLKNLNNLERIEGPIGLDIGAKNPAEIAVSILASITKDLRHGDRT